MMNLSYLDSKCPSVHFWVACKKNTLLRRNCKISHPAWSPWHLPSGNQNRPTNPPTADGPAFQEASLKPLFTVELQKIPQKMKKIDKKWRPLQASSRQKQETGRRAHFLIQNLFFFGDWNKSKWKHQNCSVWSCTSKLKMPCTGFLAKYLEKAS